MKQSKLFTKTRREAPADEVSKNAQLLIRAGYIHKEMAGVYSYLPLGIRSLNKITQIIREEMNNVDGQEILMPALQIKERYEATKRWSDENVDIWFKTSLANGTELGLGFSHEENLSPIVQNFVQSYKDLPISIYQIQNKFRNELRSKSGLMRGREFLMKDMYSYSLTQTQHEEYYERVKEAYYKIFNRVGLGDKTFITFASGGIFSKYSHEFQTISEAGEDTIYLSREQNIAVNKEVLEDEVLSELSLNKKDLEEVRAIEVGNIFSLGTKFTEPFGVKVKNEMGEDVIPIMGCYGIGIGRLMGTVVEVLSDDKGIVWPAPIAPFNVHILALGDNENVRNEAEKLYRDLTTKNVEVLFDDRSVSNGEKFNDADLIGIPYQVIVSERSLNAGGFEIKNRASGESRTGSSADVLALFM